MHSNFHCDMSQAHKMHQEDFRDMSQVHKMNPEEDFTIQVIISENFSQNNPSTFRISKFAFYNGPFYNLNQTDSNHHTFLYPGIHFVGGDLPYPCFLPLPRGHLLPQRYVRLLILYEYTGYRRFWFPMLMNILPCKVNVL